MSGLLSCATVGFLRVSAKPLKASLAAWAAKWAYLFTHYLQVRVEWVMRLKRRRGGVMHPSLPVARAPPAHHLHLHDVLYPSVPHALCASLSPSLLPACCFPSPGTQDKVVGSIAELYAFMDAADATLARKVLGEGGDGEADAAGVEAAGDEEAAGARPPAGALQHAAPARTHACVRAAMRRQSPGAAASVCLCTLDRLPPRSRVAPRGPARRAVRVALVHARRAQARRTHRRHV